MAGLQRSKNNHTKTIDYWMRARAELAKGIGIVKVAKLVGLGVGFPSVS
jgi:hypothetical protein